MLRPSASGPCTLVGEDALVGSSDLVQVRGGVVLVSQGDQLAGFRGDMTPEGGIFVVDLRRRTDEPREAVRRMTIEGMPPAHGFRFHPHGMHYSNRTGRLYAVSHGIMDATGSRVFIFRVSEDLRTLTYLRTVGSPLFRNAGIYDVVEGRSAGEIYVTEWLQAPLPPRGRDHPYTFGNQIDVAIGDVLRFVWRGARVFRCTYGADDRTTQPDCTVAATGFYAAHGITRDGDGRYYVADPIATEVRVLAPAADGHLEDVAPPIPLEFPADMIEWDHGGGDAEASGTAGSLHMGMVPQAHLLLYNPAHLPVPGTLGIVRPGHDADCRAWVHDGTQLSHVSAALAWGDRVVMGSPSGRGVLVCVRGTEPGQ